MNDLKRRSREIRENVLYISYIAGLSHIGSSLSCIEILNSIYSITNIDAIKRNDRIRDRIILSKGHGVAALYACLNIYGVMKDEEIKSICSNGSLLGGHPPIGIPYFDHPTGALGHGASVGVGMAYALKNLSNELRKVYVILGDGEIHEGSNWEAFMQADTLKLDNLYFMIDYNKLSGIESSCCSNLCCLESKLKAFNLDVETVNGDDEDMIIDSISKKTNEKAHAIICNTIKGKGISFMENDNTWHYRPLDSRTYKQTQQEMVGHAEEIF